MSRRIMPVLAAVTGVLLFLDVCLATTTYRGHTSVEEPQPTSEGQLIFQEAGCVMCHGYQGMGDGLLADGLETKPRDFTSFEAMKGIPDSRIRDVIRNGITGTAMPSFKLTENQIADVISYIRSFLADSYLTIKTCINTPITIDLKTLDIEEDYKKLKVSVERPELLDARLTGTHIKAIPSLLETYKKLRPQRVLRTHIMVYSDKTKHEKYLALIAVRIFDCIE